MFGNARDGARAGRCRCTSASTSRSASSRSARRSGRTSRRRSARRTPLQLRGEDTRRAGELRRRRDLEPRLPLGPQLRRRVEGAGRLPVPEQRLGDLLPGRGADRLRRASRSRREAYGMPGVVVDGNDLPRGAQGARSRRSSARARRRSDADRGRDLPHGRPLDLRRSDALRARRSSSSTGGSATRSRASSSSCEPPGCWTSASRQQLCAGGRRTRSPRPRARPSEVGRPGSRRSSPTSTPSVPAHLRKQGEAALRPRPRASGDAARRRRQVPALDRPRRQLVMPTLTLLQAVNDGLRDGHAATDPSVLVLRRGRRARKGGVFLATENLAAGVRREALLRHAALRGRHRRHRDRHGAQRPAPVCRDPVPGLHLPGLRPDRERGGEAALPLRRPVHGAAW